MNGYVTITQLKRHVCKYQLSAMLSIRQRNAVGARISTLFFLLFVYTQKSIFKTLQNLYIPSKLKKYVFFIMYVAYIITNFVWYLEIGTEIFHYVVSCQNLYKEIQELTVNLIRIKCLLSASLLVSGNLHNFLWA